MLPMFYMVKSEWFFLLFIRPLVLQLCINKIHDQAGTENK